MLEWILAAATVLGTVFAGWQVLRPPKPSSAPPAPATASAEDLADWTIACRENSPASYEAYLDAHTAGFFAKEARDRFGALTAGRLKVVRLEIEGDDDEQMITPVSEWLKPGDAFADDLDHENCGPEMIVVTTGTFVMGSSARATDTEPCETPAHEVTISKPFAVGNFVITFDDWDLFHQRTGGKRGIDDEGWGRGDRPAIKVTWERAQQYVEWLAATTDMPYRLLSEAEWEYCCRAGTTTAYSTGESIDRNQACFDRESTLPVGTFPPNNFGLHDMHGNVWEWCEDHWHDDYRGAPTNGSAWVAGGNINRVMRGGGWMSDADDVRSATRQFGNPTTERNNGVGFRVARDLVPHD